MPRARPVFPWFNVLSVLLTWCGAWGHPDGVSHDLQPLCLGVADYHVSPHPAHCGQYVECFGGRPVIRRCSEGLHFNYVTGICDYPKTAGCNIAVPRVSPHPNSGYNTKPPLPFHSEPSPAFLGRPHPDSGRRGRPGPRPPHRQSLGVSLRPTYEETVYGIPPSRSHGGRLPISRMLEYSEVVMEEAIEYVRKRMKRELAMNTKMHNVIDSGPHRYVSKFLNAKPYAKIVSQAAMCSLEVLKLMKDRFHIQGHDLVKVMQEVIPGGRMLRSMEGSFYADTPMPRPVGVDYCPYPQHMSCNAGYKYRTADGACNNLANALLGRSFTPFGRLLPAHYDDGIELSRRSVTGRPLPGARFASLNLFPDTDRPDNEFNMLLVFWGQFTDHDLTLTAITELPKDEDLAETEEVKCGFDGCQTDKPGQEACWPIPIPDEDPDFPYNRCMKFVRSMEAPHLNCKLAAREQLNQATQWLDGSMVYGNTMEEQRSLRDLSNPGRGALKMKSHPHNNRFQNRYYKPLLPRFDDELCRDVNSTHHCFLAGDERVNENGGITLFHVMMVREHNRIELALHQLNPHWDGERLYQETRKIVVAMMQHVTYNEWLPPVLGPDSIRKHDLEVLPKGHYYGYESHLDPRIPNSFATAAFRFGHTLLQERMHRADSDYNFNDDLFLSMTFNRPTPVFNTAHGGLDSLMRGMAGENCQKYDQFFTKQITRSLFTETPPFGPGMDLVSLNLQRARDHGLPSYNDYRKVCGFGRARTFQDLARDIPDIRAREGLRKVYGHVDDIDLFAGGISERSAPGGLVGPTFACIIGRTFRNVRKGDRFWYENDNDVGFTAAQLQEIRKATMSRILCANSDHVKEIQRWAFLMPTGDRGTSPRQGANTFRFFEEMNDIVQGQNNPRLPCESLPEPDLSVWQEGPYTTR